MQITFIRHAETEGNLAHVWQGHGDSPLTGRGEQQAADLGRRPSMAGFDLVVSSDLGRALATAGLAGLEPEPDPAWREIALGRWEGLTSAEIGARYPGEVEAMRAGEDVALGGGETPAEFAARLAGAVEGLVARCDPGDRVAVVTHGGAVQTLVAGHLGFRQRPRPWPIDRLANTSLTTFEAGGRRMMLVYNDASHTGSAGHPDETGAVVALVRHGETVANVEGRWHGVTDGPLTDEGRAQADRLAAAYDGVAHVYASDTMRARDTAAALAAASGTAVTVVGDLHELDFGAWEGLTPEEAAARHPEEWAAVYVRGRDLPRGGTGETAAGMGRRMAAAVAGIAARHPDTRVAAVSHGGAIRGYACDLVGLGFDDRSRLALPGNTEVTHVRFGAHGPSLASYNMRPGR